MPSGRWSTLFRRNDKTNSYLAAAVVPRKSASETLPYGLKVLAGGNDPVLDIVAVHGLNGHREKTWTASEINWLRDFLPSDVPRARVLTWGYDANTYSASKISAQYLYDHARTLVSDLCLDRSLTKTQTRPIVFVAHSLGGIVVKSALIHSDSARQNALEEHRSIKLSTYGIFFMGTPHQGRSGVLLGELMLKVASIFLKADDKIVKHLEKDSEWLQQQLGQYNPISRDFVTKFAYEMFPTTIALGRKIMVVPQASATIPGIANAEPVAIPADHLNMVKFASREDGGYQKVSGYLKLLAEDAPGAIDARWKEQDRIREVLSNTIDDFSVSFSLSGIPEIEYLVGREEETARIKEAFQGNGSHRRTAVLQGLGGIGKTQLAVAFVKEQRDFHSAVFWLNGKNEDMLKQSFANMAKRLHDRYPSSTLMKKAAESKDTDQIIGVMKRWLSAKGNMRWILVFDNIDNPNWPGNQDPQAYDIRSYFPEAYQGFILITTRFSRLKVGMAKVISVKKLQNVLDSIAILAHNSQRQISDQDPHAVELAKRLDGLPLALATAGAYLCQVSTSLADYLVHYNSSWLKLQVTSPELCSYEDRALYSTWNISYKYICYQNKSAGKLLQLWGYFDNQELWYALLAGGRDFSPEWFSDMIGDELSFNETLRLLCDHAFIESHGVSGGYGMHSCVHAWIMHALNTETDVSMTELALRCVGSAVPNKDVFEYWALQRRLVPHANRCLESIHNDSLFESMNIDRILSAAHYLGGLYSDQDKIKEAKEMYLWALTGEEKVFGAEHTSTLSTVNSLGNVYQKQGKMEEAEEMYLRALTGIGKAWGVGHTSTLNIANNLGLVYSDQGKLKEAEEMFLRALTGKEKAWGAENTLTLSTVRSLGVLYERQGNMKAAEEMLLRALTGYEKALGAEHTSTLDTINNLGNTYLDQDKLEAAEDMYLRALTGYEKSWGAEHTSTLNTVNNLGNLYSDQGKLKEAEEMYLRALTGYEKALGAEHTSTLSTVNNLGKIYRYQEAEQMYLRALTGFEKALGAEHTLTLLTVCNLGALYFNQGKLEEAEELYLRALTGYEKAWGAEHKEPLDTGYILALLYSEKHQSKDAIEQLELVVQGFSKVLGPDHWKTVEASERLNSCKTS